MLMLVSFAPALWSIASFVLYYSCWQFCLVVFYSTAAKAASNGIYSLVFIVNTTVSLVVQTSVQIMMFSIYDVDLFQMFTVLAFGSSIVSAAFIVTIFFRELTATQGG